MTEIDELIARMETATGPDQELDARIMMVAFAPPGSNVERSPYNEVPALFRRNGAFTSSLDVIVALIEERLPGYSVQLYIHPEGHERQQSVAGGV